MNKCSKCGKSLVRASMYDPDGTLPLYSGKLDYNNDGVLEEWWVCNNPGCEDGAKNTMTGERGH